MPFFIPFAIAIAVGVKVLYDRSRSPNAITIVPIPAQIPNKVITFVGTTGVGKSSALNAILGDDFFETGATHGTTNVVSEQEITVTSEQKTVRGYRLRDTPGLLDSIDYSKIVFNAIKDSELVVYTTSGQLLRPELDMLRLIYNRQRHWDIESKTPYKRKLALYVSQQDIRENMMPSIERMKIEAAIREQVANLIPVDRIVFGSVSSAGMTTKGIEPLRDLIINHINEGI
jgi:predicted GTPase